jgi:hypothetical protein
MKKATEPVTNAKPVSPQKGGKPGDPKLVNPEPEIIKPPTPKPKNLERFIYITTYYDSETMKILKELFESINQQAFNFKSVKETYTRTLTLEEQENNEIDYISGFQIIDGSIRITIIEGISGKAMKKVKEKLPKLKLNDDNQKVFSDRRILFNQRIYSKFNLCLKFIKLRETLNSILTTFDIYMKANKYKEIYSAFMNLGFIIESQTFKEINSANLFPPAENMLLLERKYADILKDEDMTGIKTEPKIKKKKIKQANIIDTNLLTIKSEQKTTTQSIVKTQKKEENKNENTKSTTDALSNCMPKLDSRNPNFENHLKEKKNYSYDAHGHNMTLLKNLNAKANSNNFCKHRVDHNAQETIKQNSTEDDELNTNFSTANNTAGKNNLVVTALRSESLSSTPFECSPRIAGMPSPPVDEILIVPKIDNRVYLYSSHAINYYEKYFDQMRDELNAKKGYFYTYSKDYLTLSFPMVKQSELKPKIVFKFLL